MATQQDLEAFVTRVTQPEDFGDFWTEVLDGLAEIPLDPLVSPVPMRSNEEVHVSQAGYRSLDPQISSVPMCSNHLVRNLPSAWGGRNVGSQQEGLPGEVVWS